MSVADAKIDIDSISPFQRELHTPDDESGALSGRSIVSNFKKEIRSSTWHARRRAYLNAIVSGSTVTYECNTSFHYMESPTMYIQLPTIKVKEQHRNKIRIAYTHNLGHNIIRDAQLRFGDEVVQSFDSIALDMYAMYLLEPGKRDEYLKWIGNVPWLEEWTAALPSYQLTFPQPWFYARKQWKRLPIHLLSLYRITHVYNFRNKISDLIRMQRKLSDDTWIDIETRMSYLDVSSDTLPTPQLAVRYDLLTAAEISWIRDESCSGQNIIYIEDFVNSRADNLCIFGSQIQVPLSTRTPCLSLFLVAENALARRFHNYSNYTTDSTSAYRGWSPIESISIERDSMKRFDSVSSDVFEKEEAFFHFPSVPSEPGYNAISFSNEPDVGAEDIGLVLQNWRATVLLGNTDPFESILEPELDDSESAAAASNAGAGGSISVSVVGEVPQQHAFLLHARMLVCRKLSFQRSPDGKGFVVSIDSRNLITPSLSAP